MEDEGEEDEEEQKEEEEGLPGAPRQIYVCLDKPSRLRVKKIEREKKMETRQEYIEHTRANTLNPLGWEALFRRENNRASEALVRRALTDRSVNIFTRDETQHPTKLFTS